MSLIEDLGNALGKEKLPQVHVGDTVEVHYLIKEGEKERIQLFIGTIIAIQGRGIARSILVRRIVQGEGVERLFPLHSPRVKDVRIRRRGQVRQARLFYLRDRVGKSTRVGELLGEKVRRDRDRDGSALGEESAEAGESAEGAPDAEPDPQAVEV